MSKISQLRKEIESHERAIVELTKQLDEVKPTKLYTCPSCHRRSQVKSISLIKEMAYRQPYSCTGGDYWYFSSYHIICPKCGHRARAFGQTNWSRAKYEKNQIDRLFNAELERFLFVQEYLGHFKEVLEWYKRHDFWNNTFNLDELRKEHKERERRRNR